MRQGESAVHGKARWRWLIFVGLFFLAGAVGLYLWRTLRPGMAVRTEPLPGTVVRFPHLSPDGRFLTFMDDNPKFIRIMDLASGMVRELSPGDARRAAWSADGRYLHVPGEEIDTIYGPGLDIALSFPHTTTWGWAADGPWLTVEEPDKSVVLRPVEGNGAPVPLFSALPAAVKPLVINGKGPSLGTRWEKGRPRWDLVQVERPGEAAQAVASEYTDLAAAPNGRAWVLWHKGRLALHRDGEAPLELIPPGQYSWYSGAWSPDSKWVALVGATLRKKEVLLFSADGVRKSLKLGSFERLAEMGEVDQPIRWMPDSQSFAFVTFNTFPAERRNANWVHLVDVASGRERVWRLPYSAYTQQDSRGLGTLRNFQFVDDHTLLATLRDTLYRYELR